MIKKIRVIEKTVIISNVGFSILFVLFLVIAQWPNWWRWVIFENTPMTWLEFTLLYTCSLISFGCLIFSFLGEENDNIRLWAILGFAFFCMAFDERFAIHERIRDNILAPLNIKLPIFFWTGPGDFILLIFMVIGILLLPKLQRIFRARKSAYLCFIIGVCISVVAILMDSLDVKGASIGVQRLEQFVEEILETIGMLFFLNALFLMFTHFIGKKFAKTKASLLAGG